MQKKNIIAIIPARGGSKGISQKNIAMLAGKPLIAWTIDEAKKSKLITRTIVSTDDKNIAEISRKFGVEVPFIRPKGIAKDSTSTISVIQHSLKALKCSEGKEFDYVLILQPTSPFRTVNDINNSLKMAIEKDAESVISLSEAETHPFNARKITSSGNLKSFLKLQNLYLRRQKQPTAYEINGAIYIIKTKLIKAGKIITKNSLAYTMPRERSIDIDTPWDLYIADLILQNKTLPK